MIAVGSYFAAVRSLALFASSPAAQAADGSRLPPPQLTDKSVGLCDKSAACALLRNGKPDYTSYEAEVLRVIDADTLEARVHLWLGMNVITLVRVKGVDAPERFGRAKCAREAELAEEATRFVERRYDQQWVVLDNVRPGGLGYRMEADVKRWRSNIFLSLAEELVSGKKLAVSQAKSQSKHDWCLK